GAGDVVAEALHGIEVDAEVLAHEGDVDAEFAFPHGLHGLEDAGVEVVGVHEDLEARETLAAGETGRGEQFAGGGGIVGLASARAETAGAGRDVVVGGETGALEDGGGDGLAIDGEGEGATHADVVEGFAGDVEADVERLEQRVDAQGRG